MPGHRRQRICFVARGRFGRLGCRRVWVGFRAAAGSRRNLQRPLGISHQLARDTDRRLQVPILGVHLKSGSRAYQLFEHVDGIGEDPSATPDAIAPVGFYAKDTRRVSRVIQLFPMRPDDLTPVLEQP
jgi:hypothetical protein